MRKLAICLVLLMGLSGCQDEKQQARERLQRQVAAVRDAAEARDLATSTQRLASLRENAAKMRQEGLLTEAETQRILTAALQVQTNLTLIAPAAPPAPAPAPAPPVQLEPPDSNSGGSITGSDGERGEKGKRDKDGEKGRDDDD